jgi:hypothetical protein
MPCTHSCHNFLSREGQAIIYRFDGVLWRSKSEYDHLTLIQLWPCQPAGVPNGVLQEVGEAVTDIPKDFTPRSDV